MSSNTLNISLILREEIKKQQPGMRISLEAIQELRTRFKDKIEDIAIDLCKTVSKENRKTIKEEDMIYYFSLYGNDTI